MRIDAAHEGWRGLFGGITLFSVNYWITSLGIGGPVVYVWWAKSIRMVWPAAVIVISMFLFGLNRGWNPPHDPLIAPWVGFTLGLFLFWLLRVAVRHSSPVVSGPPKQLDDRGVGTVLYWISCAVALYYVALAAFEIYLGHYSAVVGSLIGFAVMTWAIGWTIRRAFAAKIPKLGRPIRAQATHARRGAKDRGEHRQAVGACCDAQSLTGSRSCDAAAH